MKQTKHKILSVFLSFCMIISCMVGMTVTAGADTAVLKTFTTEDFCYQFSDNIEGDVTKITKVEALIDIDTFIWGHIQAGDVSTTQSAQLNTMSTNIPGVALYTYNDTRTTATYAQVLLNGNGRLLALKVTYSDSTSEIKGNWDVPEFKAPTAKTGLTANGSAQALVSEGVITSGTGTIEYSLDNSNWSTDIPKGTDAEDYTVYYRVKYGSEYYQPLYNGIQVTIGEPSTPATVAVTGVTLAPTTANLTVGGDAVALTATVAPANATDKKVTWSVGGDDSGAVKLYSNEACTTEVGTNATETLTVYAKGVSAGNATVTATSNANNTISATCAVTVNAASAGPETYCLGPYAQYEDVQLISVGTILKPGDSIKWYGSGLNTYSIIDTDNNTIATFDNSQAYYGYTLGGTKKYEVTALDNVFESDCNATIHVKEVTEQTAVAVTGVTLDKTTASIEVGKTVTLTATVTPDNATDKTVTWTSSDTSVATVANGVVKAVGAGTATITAKAGGKSATCEVTVNAATVAVTGVTLDKTTATIEVGKTETLTATVTPANATDKTVKWSVVGAAVELYSDAECTTKIGADATDVLTVYAKGIAGGYQAEVNVTSNADNTRSATCTVTVSAATVAVTGVTLNKTTATIEVGKTETLTATVEPSDATNKTVTWTSDNTAVATVANGVVKAVGAGTATITAKAGDKTATCEVTVNADVVPVTAIELNYTTYSMTVDESNALSTSFTPADATDLTLTFASSDTSVVTISDIGLFTAVGVGTATLTVTATNGTADTSDDVTATCVVTVTAASGGGNSGGSSGYRPSYPTTTTTTTTTNTGSFADETKENTNYSGAQINMKSDDLKKAVLTDEDKKVIAAGGNVTVELEVEEKTPTAEEKKEVEAAVEAAKEASGEDYTVAMYFDANLFKTSNGTKTQLHETNGKIAVSFKLPAQFKNTDSSVTRTYAVARIHDGKTEILVCEYDPETDLLTFYTDKFSTYALMFEDAPAATDTAVEETDDDEDTDTDTGDDFDELTDDSDDDDDAEDTNSTISDDDSDDADDDHSVDNAVDDGNPHTGAPLAGMGVFAVMSFFAAAAAYTAKKRKNK